VSNFIITVPTEFFEILLVQFWIILNISTIYFLFSGQGFDGLAKIFVTLHKPSSTFIVVKQTDVDFQSSQQLEDLKVCISIQGQAILGVDCQSQSIIFNIIINLYLTSWYGEALPSLPSRRLVIMYTTHSHTLPLHSMVHTHYHCIQSMVIHIVYW
jgi:hypothetical protein